ncbi:hypothetical protein BV20DRAFT_561681 [Pilatotrama ljubarskyi]|nr:hypothetical protein BV20DRAFT_561681 [Pilatotrama ljubarskyi]
MSTRGAHTRASSRALARHDCILRLCTSSWSDRTLSPAHSTSWIPSQDTRSGRDEPPFQRLYPFRDLPTHLKGDHDVVDSPTPPKVLPRLFLALGLSLIPIISVITRTCLFILPSRVDFDEGWLSMFFEDIHNSGVDGGKIGSIRRCLLIVCAQATKMNANGSV